jgi:hypothetical protein
MIPLGLLEGTKETRMRRAGSIALILLFSMSAPAFAQGNPPKPTPGQPAGKDAGKTEGEPLNPQAVEKLLKFGYTYRREGNYDAASSAFRGVLPNVQGEARK